MTEKKKTEEKAAKPAAPPPKDTTSLEALIAAQAQQIAELQKSINQGVAAQGDPTQSQFERMRRAEHERLEKISQRTPEKDADPRLAWVGDRYQMKPVPRGFVPVEEVKEYNFRPPEAPTGATPGKSALPAGLVVPGDVQKAGG